MTTTRSDRAAATSRVGLLFLAALTILACDDGVDPFEAAIVPVVLEAAGDAARLQVLSTHAVRPTDWESLDPGIATVTSDGVVTAVSEGLARVRVRVLGANVAEGEVEVLPPVSVIVREREIAATSPGRERVTLRLANAGGRGAYRIEMYRRGTGGESIPVWIQASESPAPVGMEEVFEVELDVPDDELHAAKWVVIRSREANRHTFVATWCDLLYGEGFCIIP